MGFPLPWYCLASLSFHPKMPITSFSAVPQKELHGMSALSSLKVILENSLGSWVQGFYCFGDSEIALSWVIYERVKLTTFVRNRVINIRTKMGLELLHHVEGPNNPTDIGTRPEEITAESVKPGSVCIAPHTQSQ